MKYKTKITDSEILKKWLKFYLLTDVLSLIGITLGGSFKNFYVIDHISMTLFLAPIFETITVQLPLVAGLIKLKLKPIWIILPTSVIFSFLHIFSWGIMGVIALFYPLTMMTWCFYFFYTRCNWMIAFFTTTIIHMIFNLTALYCSTMIG